MAGKYEDILYLSRPVSKKHPHLSNKERAAQFAPFAALTGYTDTIKQYDVQEDRSKQKS